MSYSGYSAYETWNVVLWISNDEGLYNIASDCSSYDEFIDVMRELGSLGTPDNVAWDDSGIDRGEVEEACFTREVENETVD